MDFCDPTAVFRLNLETAGGRKKDAYGIGGHGEIKKFVGTLGVMRHFLLCEVRQELAETFVIQLRFLGKGRNLTRGAE